MQEDRNYCYGGVSKSPVEGREGNKGWQRSTLFLFSFLMLMFCLNPLPALATPEMGHIGKCIRHAQMGCLLTNALRPKCRQTTARARRSCRSRSVKKAWFHGNSYVRLLRR